MDKKDKAIICVPKRSAKLSNKAIARTGYRAIINYKKTDTPIGAFVFINLAEAIPEKSTCRKRT